MRPSPAGRVGPGEREGYGGPRDVTSLSLSLRLYTSQKSDNGREPSWQATKKDRAVLRATKMIGGARGSPIRRSVVANT